MISVYFRMGKRQDRNRLRETANNNNHPKIQTMK